TQAKGVELVDPGVVARFRAARLGYVLELRSGERIERPALGAMLAGCRRPVEDLAFLAVEARQVSARQRRPENAVAVDVAAARPITRKRRLIDFGQCRMGRIGPRIDPHDIARAGKSPRGPPDCAVYLV